jgi:hypothetical protein
MVSLDQQQAIFMEAFSLILDKSVEQGMRKSNMYM